MTRGDDFQKRAKRENKHSSTMSVLAWSDLISKSDLLKIHCCTNPKGIGQKKINFTPREFRMEGAGFKKKS